MAFNYKLLGKFNFRIVLFSGIIEVLFTILLCYILAVKLKHKPMWLPTISECGEMPPERYFFRWGILVGGLLLVVESVVLHTAKRSSDWVFVLGIIAGLGLTGVAAVASNENLPLHLGEACKVLPWILFTYHNCKICISWWCSFHGKWCCHFVDLLSAVFALGFFLLEDVMVVLFISENYHSLSQRSLVLKIPSAVVTCAATVARCILQ